MAARSSFKLDLTTTAVVSIAAHAMGAFLVVGALTLAGSAPTPRDHFGSDPWLAAAPRTLEIELEPTASPNPDEAPPSPTPTAAPDTTPRGSTVARVDTGRSGRGGDPTSRLAALNLADRDDAFIADRSVLSRLDRSQLPRLDKAMTRKAYEDFRASRDPMIVTFFNVGAVGPDAQRAEMQPLVTGAGARQGGPRSDEGSILGGKPGEVDGFDPGNLLGSDREGAKRDAGRGLPMLAKTGPESAKTMANDARPLVDQADPSVFANDRGKPSDNVDAEQEVASLIQKIVTASPAGGPRGDGRGGEGGGGTPGAGAKKGFGSSSSTLGSGGTGEPDPRERARTDYVRCTLAKIQPLWGNAFPAWAIAEGRQGKVVLAWTVSASGERQGVRITQGSGIGEFDRNVLGAVGRAGSCGPLPTILGTSLGMTVPFVAKNPVVRPKDPGEGITMR